MSLVKLLQELSFRYPCGINRRQWRNGHLFQGRYRALLVAADNYLLAWVRYLHRNPVLAARVTHPLDPGVATELSWDRKPCRG